MAPYRVRLGLTSSRGVPQWRNHRLCLCDKDRYIALRVVYLNTVVARPFLYFLAGDCNKIARFFVGFLKGSIMMNLFAPLLNLIRELQEDNREIMNRLDKLRFNFEALYASGACLYTNEEHEQIKRVLEAVESRTIKDIDQYVERFIDMREEEDDCGLPF